MKTVKVAIIGCGGIANNKHMPALKELDYINIVAFCDIIEERAIKAAKEYGVEGARVYTDYDKLLKEEEVTAVHVCTPNSSHCDISVAAMKSDKHVICEKPMAKTSEEARKMVAVSKETKKILTIGYQNRFRQDSMYLEKLCKRGDLGDIYLAKAHAIRRRAVPTWGVFLDEEAQGGGPLIDIGTHALDLTLWTMNNYEVQSVKGNVYRKLADQTDTGNVFGDWDPKEFTVEDSAFGFITMKDGATVYLEASWALNTLDVGEAQTSLCGTKAGADMKDGLRINTVDLGKQTVIKPALDGKGVAFFDGAGSKPEVLEAECFYNAILNGGELVVKPEQALVVTEILEAMYESAKTGKTIEFE